MPQAKNLRKISVMIVNLENKSDFQYALSRSFSLAGERVYVNPVQDAVCYCCGQKDYIMNCPLNPPRPNLVKTPLGSNARAPVKILSSMETYKTKSKKMIQCYSSDRDKEIEVLRKKMQDMQKKKMQNFGKLSKITRIVGPNCLQKLWLRKLIFSKPRILFSKK